MALQVWTTNSPRRPDWLRIDSDSQKPGDFLYDMQVALRNAEFR